MKMELTSDSGKTHAIVENPEEFKKMGIDIIDEMKSIMEQQETSTCIDELTSINEDLVYLGDKPEQYADAIVGITYDGNHVVYSTEAFQECLVKEGMTPEEAADWISYNTARSLPYMGEHAPILMNELER
jgi:hypothetical protein